MKSALLCAALLAVSVLSPAQANGSIRTDRYGEVVCGAGARTTDVNGVIRCAAAPGGSVSTSPAGELTCDGGCVVASSSACQSGPAN